MKRTVVLVLVMGLAFGAITSVEAAKKKKKKVEREATGSYDSGPLVIAGTCAQTGAIGCVAFSTGPKELFVTKAKVTDAHGQPVAVGISANTDGNTGDDVAYGEFCGELEEPIQVEPGVELHFWVGTITDVLLLPCAPGLATTGEVTITLSNMP